MFDLSWLNSRPSFELAVMFVTWLTILMLAVLVVSLHYRLMLLEQAHRVLRAAAPYGHLAGRHVWTPERATAAGGVPDVVLLLSSGCKSCDGILRELRDGAVGLSPVVMWKGSRPASGAVPDWITVVPDGASLSEELGVNITPFALKLDRHGNVRSAMPVSTLKALEVPVEQAKAAAYS